MFSVGLFLHGSLLCAFFPPLPPAGFGGKTGRSEETVMERNWSGGVTDEWQQRWRDNQRNGSISSSDKYLNFKGASADMGGGEGGGGSSAQTPAPPPPSPLASPLSQSSPHAAVFRS